MFKSLISFLTGMFKKTEIPGKYEFRGHLDSPREGLHSNLIAGWYLSKAPFHKVVACVNGKELFEIKKNSIRKDVALSFSQKGYKNPEKSGFHYMVPEKFIQKYLGDRMNRSAVASIRFYITRHQYVEKFAVKFVLYYDEYDLFLMQEERQDRGVDVKAELNGLNFRPKISIITPVYNPPKKYFLKMVKSVLDQAYPDVEFCVCFDGKQPALERELRKFEDPRIKTIVAEQRLGICGATNQALKLASGDFVAFLDHDDILHKHAILEIVKALNKNKKADLIYTDEDKVDEKDRRYMPFFKPDFSPHHLLCQNYICHLLVVRKSLADAVGGVREDPAIAGSQDWDLILRVLERTKNVLHVPKVLYSWRNYKKSVSRKLKKERSFLPPSIKVLSDYVARNKISARVSEGLVMDTYKIDFDIEGSPKVSIIMPTGGKIKLLATALRSILNNTSYPNYEIIVVDNSGSKEHETTAAKVAVARFKNRKIRYFRKDLKPFNFSKLINFGVRRSRGEYLLLFNDDMEIINKGWLTEMLKIGQLKDVGAVGAKLYFPNNTIQHVGVVIGIHDVADHIFKQKERGEHGYFFSNFVYKDLLAVTGACLLTKKKLFLKAKGLDEEGFRVAYQDIDYCMKLYDMGYYNVVTPYAELYHHEGLTKTVCVRKGEIERFQKKWKKYIDNDPFYNPNLSKRSLEYKIDV
jgi:glycosyltransferase involved in cell wall biosynthesis